MTTSEEQISANGSAPFGSGAAHYVGWSGIIPIHRRTKVPFSGFTGRDGVQVTYEQSVAAAADRRYASSNLAMRLPRGVLGLDVDAYDDKPGGTTLERMERELGALPATWRSGSRMPEDAVSGIRLFRVPEDTEFDGVAGPGIEIVQHHHRTVMAWPSVHPKTGRVYQWAGPDGQIADRPPMPEELPELPDRWVDHLARSAEGRVVGDGAGVSDFLTEHAGTDNPRIFDTVSEKFRAAVAKGEARHDSMLKALGAAMRDAARGYYPAAVAEERLREMWDGATSGEGRDAEYADLLERAIGDVNVGAERFKRALYEEVHGTRRARSAGDNRFSDAYMAQTVADEVLRGRFVWTQGMGWLCWDGKVWSRCVEKAAIEAVRLYVISQVQAAAQRAVEMQEGAQEDLAGWTKLVGGARIKTITSLAGGVAGVMMDDADLDRDPDLLNCQNGIVDLRSGVLLDHNPDRLMTRICGADYDPTAKDEGWGRILEAMPQEIIPWMQVRCGQAATGYRTPDDRVPLLQGTGSNGKTTFTAALALALGSYHVLVPDNLLLGQKQRDESMTLRGARFALMEETPQGAQLNSVMLKKATSPEMTGHHLYASETSWKATHSLAITTNYRPVVTETDDGTWRRLALVEFPYRYVSGTPDPDQNERAGDGTLRGRVEQEDPDILRAVLAWLVAGARLWYASAGELPDLPDRVVQDTLLWRRETDLVLAYLDECLEFDYHRHVRCSDTLMDFNDWLESKGHQKWSDRRFSQQFGSHDAVTRRKVIKRKIMGPDDTVSNLGMFDRKGGQFPRNPTPNYWAWAGLKFAEEEKNQDHQPAQPAENKVSPACAPRESLKLSGSAGSPAQTRAPSDLQTGPEDPQDPLDGYPEDPFAEIPAPAALEVDTSGPLAFDIETPSAKKLFTYRSRPEAPFSRLNGALGPDGAGAVTTDPQALIRALEAAPVIHAHNGLRYDLMALAWHHGADYDALAKKTWDTYVDEATTDPSGGKYLAPWNEEGYYGLDRALERRGEPGKTDHLPALAKPYGEAAGYAGKEAVDEGYERIPVDDPQYNAYLHGDLKGQDRLYRHQMADTSRMDYRRREQRVAYIQNRMTYTGWKIDVPLLRERVAEEQTKVTESLQWLSENAGVPLTETKSRGRGKNKVFYEEPRKSPLGSNAGKEALIRAFAERGLPYHLTTESGSLALNKDALSEGSYMVGKGAKGKLLPGLLNPARKERTPGADWEAIEELADHIRLVTTAVQKYAEIYSHLIGDRVHGHVGETQGSGRWAMVKPSVTNLGKRGGKVIQRAPFIADDGCVLMAFDLDQVDMRAFAGHCGDPAYVDMFVQGQDPHSMIANMVFGAEGCACPDKTAHTCEKRERSKASGHGWNYGLSVNGLVNSGIERSLAERFDAGMNEGYPTLCSWRTEVRGLGESGQLLDNGFGRLMRVDPRRAYTQAPALCGQGTARDILVEGLLRLPDEYVPWMRGVVHDEVIFNVPEDRVQECIETVTAALTFDLAEVTGGRLHSVPITTGASRPGHAWHECYLKD